jgi:chaperonin GroEL
VTVARAVDLKDPIEAVGAAMVREVASKTVDVVGDGTTTATVLARAIYKEGVKLVAAGSNPTALKRGIDAAVEAVVGKRDESGIYRGGALQNISIPVSGNMVAQVGKISSNDQEIGDLLAQAMDRVGPTGVITLDASHTLENLLDVVEGMDFDRGYIKPQFITNTTRREAILDNGEDSFVYLLLVDKRMSVIGDIKPFFERPEALQKDTRPFLVIAEDVEGEVINALVVNKTKGILNCCAVKAPGFGDRRRAMLEDIAILTGGTVITEGIGRTLDKIDLSDLGKARRIVIGKDSTAIIGGMGDPLAVAARIDELTQQIETAATDFDREKLRERLAKLSSGVAILRLGATTDTELKEKKDRAEDALHATRAAVEEGIVPGGGTALIRCARYVQSVMETLVGDERWGAGIVLKAIEAPLYQIAANAGVKADVVVESVQECRWNGGVFNSNFGYNAATGTYEDLVVSGVIDPAKVVRVALQNAASIAGLQLITEALLVDIPIAMPTLQMGSA